jgi:hypothetical protein
MDLTKFLSILEDQCLTFVRADEFDDPYEGSWTEAEIKALRKAGGNDTYIENLLKISEHLKQYVYVSCWHANDYESAAMWDLYSQRKEGIAIRTDYESLSAALNLSSFKVSITNIKY